VRATDLSLVPHLLDYRCWEPHVTRYLKLNLCSAVVFMDVVAHLGYYIVLRAPLVKRVIAFEPVCISHHYCKTNIALNNLSNVDLYQCGLWHGETNTRIRIDRSSMVSAYISSNDGAATDGESIRCVSLDG
jgi:FkbM family methyltransferase